MDHLSLAQQNVAKSPTFLNNIPFLDKKRVDLYVICEPPKTITQESLGVPYLSTPHSLTAIIIINQNLSYTLVEEESNAYVTTIKLSNPDLKIVSVYYPPGNHHEVVEPFITRCIDHRSPSTLVLGDLNATTSLLGDTDSIRGHKLMSLVSSNSWSLLNEPNIPTRKRGSTAIDWSISSVNIANNFTWSCSKYDKSLSDHCIIYIKSNYAQPFNGNGQIQTFVNMKSFLSSLLQHSVQIISQDLPMFLSQAVDCSLQNTVRKRKQAFFDEKCMISKQVVRQALRKFRKNGARFPELQLELDKANKIHEANVAAAKEKHWSNKLKECKHVGDVFGLIRSNRIAQVPVERIIHEGNLIDDPTQCADLALDHFYPQNHASDSLISFIVDGPKDAPITRYEVDIAIDCQRSNCPGIDKVNLKLVLLIHHYIPDLLHTTFNYWFFNESIPPSMKRAVITLIKKNSQVANHLSNLRPISLTNIISKLFERILQARMLWHLNNISYSSVNQFGFSIGKSTEDALRAIMKARTDFANDKDVVFALDVSGAFNNVSHAAIVRECTRLKFSRSIINTIVNYLSDRRVCINLDTNVSRVMTRGVPQGTILGPLLFKLAFDVFIRNLTALLGVANVNNSIVAFADDCNIIVSATQFVPCMTQMCAWLLTQVNTILGNIGLCLNLSKVQILHSGSRTSIPVQNVSVSTKQEVNILGVNFQAFGKFPRHIKLCLEEIEARVDALKCYTSSGNLSLVSRIALVGSSIHSIITYAADVILSSPIPPDLVRSILFIDRKIASHLYAISYSSSYASSIITLRHNSLLYALIHAAEKKKLRASTEFNLKFDSRKRILHRIHPADRIKVNFKLAYSDNQITHPPNLTLAIYTDGSKKSDGHATSAAFVTWNPSSSKWDEFWYKLPVYATAAQAERHALLKAISFIHELQPAGVFHVLSDSRSMLMAIAHSQPKDSVIHDIQQLIHSCFYSNKIIHWTWVKGHADIAGNILADRACVNALDSYTVPEYVHQPVGVAYKSAEDSAVASLIRYMSAFPIKPDESLVPSFEAAFSLKLNLNYFSAAFYSNRAPTKARLKKLGLANSDKCPCGQTQSTQHLFVGCPVVTNMFPEQFSNANLSSLVGKTVDEVLASQQLHNYILKIAKPLLSWLETSNGTTYFDSKNVRPVH